MLQQPYSNEAEVENFYADLELLTKNIKKHEVIIIMGHFNVIVGRGKIGNIVENFELEGRNGRSDRLVQYC